MSSLLLVTTAEHFPYMYEISQHVNVISLAFGGGGPLSQGPLLAKPIKIPRRRREHKIMRETMQEFIMY